MRGLSTQGGPNPYQIQASFVTYHSLCSFEGVLALDHANQDHDDRNQEKEVDESSERVARDEPEAPEDEQQHSDSK